MFITTSCHNNEIEGIYDYKHFDFAVEGIADYTITNKGFTINLFVPKEGADLTMEAIGEYANFANFTCIEGLEKGDILYNSQELPTDLENFNFYGDWFSIVYESLKPIKFKIHFEANKNGNPRHFNIYLNGLPHVATTIKVVQK